MMKPMRRALAQVALAALLPLLLGTVRLKDAHGREVVLERPPERVLSGSLASDEVALELLDGSSALKRLVGVSSLADDRRYSNVVPVPAAVRGRFGGDVEAALTLSPDLVLLATFNRPEAVRRFEQARVRVFVLPDFTSFAGVLANIATVGALLGEAERAAALQRRFGDELAALEKRAQPLAKRPPRVLHAYDDGTVSGSGTLLDAIVRAAGGVNAASAASLAGWKKASIEALLAMDPDFVVVGGDDPKAAAAIPGFDKLRAVKTGAVIAVPGNELGAVSHHVLKAVRKVQDGLLARAGGEAKP